MHSNPGYPQPSRFSQSLVRKPGLREVKKSSWGSSTTRLQVFRPISALYSRFQSHHPPGWQLCSSSTSCWVWMLTFIHGWFINCIMVSLSVGSVFSSRRISCLARDQEIEQGNEVAVPNPLHRAQFCEPRNACDTMFLTCRNSKLTTISCFKTLSVQDNLLIGN